MQVPTNTAQDEPVAQSVTDDQSAAAGQPPETLPGMRETIGDIGRIAWPSITEMILTSLAGLVDQVMVGNLNPLAISAVGLTNQPKMLLQACFIAFNVGSTALIARFRGAGQQGDACRVMRQNMMLTLFISAVMSVIGYIFAEPMIRFMGSNEPQTLAWGIQYFRIQMVGLTSQTLAMSVTAALRGVGNTRASLVLNTSSNIVNVFLNYGLIYGNFGMPRMEVAGASIATVAGQMVALAGALIILYRGRQYVFLLPKDSFMPDIPLIKRITRIGLPALGEQLCMRFGMTVFVKTVTSLGDIAFATHQIGMSMMNISFMNGQAFGIAATTLVGQSLGKKKPKLAYHYARLTGWMGQGVSVFIAMIFIIFRKQLISMFIGADVDPSIDTEQIVLLGSQILLVLAALQPFQSSQLILAGALRGAGDTRYTLVVILVGMLFLRPALSWTAVNVLHWGLVGAWSAMFVDQFSRFVLVRLRFQSGKWTTVKV